MTGRGVSLVAALALVPTMARSATPAEPAESAAVAAPADSQTSSTSGAGTNPGSVTIPPKLQERTDFQLTLTTLEALRKKGMMSEEEYNAALRDLITVGSRASSAPTFVVGRFVTTLYGYLEGDIIHDNQRATLDSYGGSPVLAPKGTYVGDDGRTVFSSRGTRLGIRFAAPEVSGLRVRGNFEMDFVGNQPGTPTVTANAAPTISEASFFDNPTPRIRIALVQADTDFVTLSVGQTWNVMAFAAAYLPTSVQPQGLPGQLFGRNPQLRLSHLFDAKAFSADVAVAALRSPQFDSEVPDFQGGIKFNINGWTGVQSIGSTATTISPASVAFTAATRMIRMANAVGPAPGAAATAAPTQALGTETVHGHTYALNAFIPVIAAKERGPFALSLLGEASTGTGMADLFTGMTGGMTPGQPIGVTAANYAPFRDVDNGIAGFTTAPNGISGPLTTVDFRTVLVGAQFSLSKVILAGSYSNVYSSNVAQFTGANWNHQMWWDANLLVDPWSGVRFGLEFARTEQVKVSGVRAFNNRVFFGSFFIF